MNVNKKLLTGLIGIAVVTIFAGMAAGEFRGAKKAEGPRIAVVTTVQKTFRLQGKFEEELSGPYDLLFKIYSNESQEELIAETTFPQVAFEGGFYTIDVDPSSLGLKQGKDYWLTIDIPETEIPTQEAKLEIVAKNTIQLNADGEDRGTITGGQDYVGNFSDYMVKITNKGTGYTIWAVSEKGTAVYAKASAPGKYAVHAENPQGTALFVDGKAKVQGDLEVTGQTNLSNVTLPANSVGSSQITDGSVGQAELAAGSVNSSKIQDAVIMDADIAGNANIEASKVNRSGLDADLLDGKDSSEFTTPWVKNGTDISYSDGNVGIGTTSPSTKLDVSGVGMVSNFGADPAAIRIGGSSHAFVGGYSASANNNPSAYLSSNIFYDGGPIGNGWPRQDAGRNTAALILQDGSMNLYTGTTDLGSQKFTVLNTGNVGIGTKFPSTTLDVAGDISAGAEGEQFIIHTRSNTGSDFLQITSRDGGGDWKWGQGITLRDATGNVGIGTTSPSTKLDVSGVGMVSNFGVDPSAIRIGDSSHAFVGGYSAGADNRPSVYLASNIFYDGGPIGNGWPRQDASRNTAALILQDGSMNLYTGTTDLGSPKFTVLNTGNVGIGTTAPASELDVRGLVQITDNTAVPDTRVYASFGVTRANVAENNAYIGLTKQSNIPWAIGISSGASLIIGIASDGRIIPNPFMTIGDTGNVGIGTTNPSGVGLGIGGSNINGRILGMESGDSSAFYLNNTTTGNKFGIFGENDARGNFSSVGAVSNNAFSIKTNNQERITVTPGGRVGIGTTNPGAELDVNGTISGDNVTANYQDLAEWVESPEQLEPGTVVAIEKGRKNRVVASTQAYDPKVAGVVSKQPGFILGEGGEGQYMIAHSGRVSVKVNAGYGAIEEGDLLVTSPDKGVAMKSQPKLIDGEEFHRPGTILGKALEPLSEGQGEILVLLSLQ